MSYAPCKVVFEDGYTLYTIGDCSEIALNRLYPTVEQAKAAYYENDESYVTDGELLFSRAEPVTCWTLYGTDHKPKSWVEMHTQNAEADRHHMLLTLPPHHPEPLDRFGFGEWFADETSDG